MLPLWGNRNFALIFMQNKVLTEQVKPQCFVNGFKRCKFSADKLVALIFDENCFFYQGTLGVIKVKLNFHLITDGKVLFDIQSNFHPCGGYVFNRHQAPVLGLAVNKMDIGPRQVCLFAVLLSFFQNSLVGMPAWAFDIDLDHFIKGRIFGNIDGFCPRALRTGKGRHLFAGYINFFTHLIQPGKQSTARRTAFKRARAERSRLLIK